MTPTLTPTAESTVQVGREPGDGYFRQLTATRCRGTTTWRDRTISLSWTETNRDGDLIRLRINSAVELVDDGMGEEDLTAADLAALRRDLEVA